MPCLHSPVCLDRTLGSCASSISFVLFCRCANTSSPQLLAGAVLFHSFFRLRFPPCACSARARVALGALGISSCEAACANEAIVRFISRRFFEPRRLPHKTPRRLASPLSAWSFKEAVPDRGLCLTSGVTAGTARFSTFLPSLI